MIFTNNYFVKMCYKFLFYFELGRGTYARFYSWIPEILIILGGLKYLFNINMNKLQMITGFIILILLFVNSGLLVKKFGFYDIDRRVQVSKDPVMNEIYKAAIKINNK